MQSYDPSQVKLVFGDREWLGCHEIIEVKEPWYRIVPKTEIGKTPHVEGATRIEMCIGDGLYSTINLVNTSPSLEYILGLDPFDWNQNRQMKLNGEVITRENVSQLMESVNG
jgi:hypothetical protein